MMRSLTVAALVLGSILGSAKADVTLPALFSDHMVAQADRPVAIWGWAEAGEVVTVSVNGETVRATADASGKWNTTLPAQKAGGPIDLTVSGKNSITVRDVLFGQVWLCSGQSNMAMTVNRCNDFEKEAASADHPQIRMFKESSGSATTPQEKAKGSWEVCSPKTVGGFSGTAYFFGRKLHQELKQPIGLINTSVGGTPVEAWTSWEAQKDKSQLAPLFTKWDKDAESWNQEAAEARFKTLFANWKATAAKARAEGKQPPRQPQKPVNPRLNTHHPSVLFNGKVAPLIPYTVRGFLWYQGENNAGGQFSGNYGLQLRTMIEDWRTRWGEELPFAWVQLPNFHARQSEPVQETGWTTVREEMTRTLSLPKTGMAITLDVGEANDIHPKDKQTVGQRLADWALASVYGQTAVTASGPLYSRHTIEGDRVLVEFRYADRGLKCQDEKLEGFAIAGSDRKWHHADARIEGSKVIVTHPEVMTPVAVRYAWTDNPVASLRGPTGVPAAPFRTDDWPLTSPQARRANR